MKNISISATRSQLSAETSPAFHGSFMGGEEEEEECGLKKRRLGVEQVKELERSFEEQNRLEPQMKIKLAKELGLQPRQIAIWFQNRRARWKTKKLEREYEQLRADYEVLKHHFQVLQRDKEKLVAELNQLRAKVSDEKRNSRGITETIGGNCAEGNFVNFRAEAEERSLVVTSSLGDLRDGSESDSSGNNSPHRRTTTGIVSDQYGSSLRLGYPGEGSDFGLQIPPENRISGNQLLRLEEEHGFVNPDGCASIFGEEQLSAFPWVWPEHWTQ